MNKIRKYRIGNPIQTDAVVEKIAIQKGKIPYLKKEEKSFVYPVSYTHLRAHET